MNATVGSELHVKNSVVYKGQIYAVLSCKMTHGRIDTNPNYSACGLIVAELLEREFGAFQHLQNVQHRHPFPTQAVVGRD